MCCLNSQVYYLGKMGGPTMAYLYVPVPTIAIDKFL